jgi:ABC-2 type transport system ATP-binding protein
MKTVIEINQLVHHFGPVRALNGLTLTVNEGEVFGVLGPNGAGKTTTVRLLNGVLSPSSGTMQVLGMDPTRQGCDLRRKTGVLTETPSLYERLTARDNLQTFGALYGIPKESLNKRVDQTLELFGLLDRANSLVGGFSKGMKQRLALARAMMHEPQLLFLDEPTSALDPQASHQVTETISQLSHQQGRTVFLCTHNLDEAERLCDRVAVLNKGSLLAVGTLNELADILWHGLWVDLVLEQPVRPADTAGLSGIPGVFAVESQGTTLMVQVDRMSRIPDLIAALVGLGVRMQQVMPRKHSLEDIYFELQKAPTEAKQSEVK